MKLKDYMTTLEKLVKENPKCLDMDIVYGVDDEGNEFIPVSYEPQVGVFKNKAFYTPSEYKHFSITAKEENAVCIN